MNQVHSIAPIFDKNSKILILGSFPSVKSRKIEFFYGHSQNRFWQVLSTVLNCELPTDINEKKNLLLSHNIALWDVIQSCEIVGSSDSSIKNVVPNNLSIMLENCNIKQIYVNGKTANKLYVKHIQPIINRSVIVLPSTSPANAAYNLNRLTDEWRKIKNELTI